MGKKSKKVNPRLKPATMADLNKARKQAESDAISYAWAIMFTVMRDKFDFTIEQLQEFWDGVGYLSDSIAKGYVDVNDLMKALDDEAGIVLDGGKK